MVPTPPLTCSVAPPCGSRTWPAGALPCSTAIGHRFEQRERARVCGLAMWDQWWKACMVVSIERGGRGGFTTYAQLQRNISTLLLPYSPPLHLALSVFWVLHTATGRGHIQSTVLCSTASYTQHIHNLQRHQRLYVTMQHKAARSLHNQAAHFVMRASPVGQRTPGDTSGTCLHASNSRGPAAW